MDIHDLKHSLEIIRVIESNDCKNTKHKSDAKGCYGLRPIAVKDIGVTYSDLTQHIIAKQYAKKILRYRTCPGPSYKKLFLAYAWYNGVSKARSLERRYNCFNVPYRNKLADHWYVKRYLSASSSSLRLFELPSRPPMSVQELVVYPVNFPM